MCLAWEMKVIKCGKVQGAAVATPILISQVKNNLQNLFYSPREMLSETLLWPPGFSTLLS